MKILTISLMTAVLLALSGCNPAKPGGPGTTAPPSEKPLIGQTDDTFRLTLPMMATKLNQGEAKTVSVGINRATNFDQKVTLSVNDLPTGISVSPESAVIESTDEKVDITIMAAADASLGDFKLKIVGRPETGGEAITEMTLTVSKSADVVEGNIPADASLELRAQYIQEMQAELDAVKAKYEALKLRAEAEVGDAKAELEQMLAEAKLKLDAAEATLADAKNPATDRWEQIKEGFSSAMADLKSLFD